MKKFLLFIVLLLFPLTINAEDIEYDITDYYIKANILNNGDLEVNELIVLDGTFNGYEREVAFKNLALNSYDDINFEHDAIYNANGISNYKVQAKNVNKVSFDTFNENFNEIKVDVKESLDSTTYRMYYRTDDKKTAFLLSYTIDDAVVIHNDVAELYWTFIGQDYTDEINNLNIRVYLPNEDNSEYFRIWAHGDLTGEIYKYDNSYIEATANRIFPNSPVDIRTTFDKSLINEESILDHSDTDALDKIIEVETKRANEANRKRKINKVLYFITLIISGIIFLWQIISIILIYLKYDKEYKSDFTNDYNREIIDDYNVEIVDYIMNKNVTPNAMSASIMNMIYKKNIKSEKLENEKKEEYKFTLLNKENLTDTEIILINLLFDKVGNGQEFTTKMLKDYAKSTKTYESFNNSYTGWKKNVILDGKKLNIFETHGKVIAYSLMMILITGFINFLSMILNIGTIFPYINIFLAIIILIYCIAFYKRTVYGNEQYVRWKAFKKFLEDFGDFENKELPEISLWEKYMVYATVFGISDKVAKVMNVKIKEMKENGTYVDTYTPYFYHCNLAHCINNAITTSISNAQATAASVASSSYSSGSGFGGGFSSGGGFGGGGGGGHGF